MHVIGIIVIFSWKLIANVDPVIGSAYCNIAILLDPNNCHKVGTLGVGGRCSLSLTLSLSLSLSLSLVLEAKYLSLWYRKKIIILKSLIIKY